MCVCVCVRYSTWEPEDNILDPRLVLAFEEKEERDRAQAHRRKGLRPRRLILRNIYTMELRSAQKSPEKPASRFRLSLARSVGAGLQHNGRRCRTSEGGVYHHHHHHYHHHHHRRLLKSRSKECVAKPSECAESPRQRTLTPEKEAAEEEEEEDEENKWDEEDDQQKKKKRRKTQTDEHHDIPHAQEMTEGHDPSSQEPVITDRKPELYNSSPERKAAPPGTETDPATRSPEQPASATPPPPNEQKPITDTSGGGVSPDEPPSDQLLKSSSGAGVVTDRVQNRASVITVRRSSDRFTWDEERKAGETDSKEDRGTEVTAECTTTLKLRAEVRTDECQASESERHPGKVIVTNVTINSLTVTFKEAMTAEGFFSSYGLQV
ncbi:chromobox-like 7a [Silurus meridionalis]|nr:chromobox-like 7a [Silurus meridionalis]